VYLFFAFPSVTFDLHTPAVYALDRLPEPSPDFAPIAEKAKKELGTSLEYRQIDVRDVKKLHEIVEEIANKEGRLDGLIAAAGIQQETTALEYTAEDANRMFEVNITGVMMTAQAAAKQMIKFGNGGSIVLIASMSGHIANRVPLSSSKQSHTLLLTDMIGPHLLGVQCV
jgi:NAD(P)-dependent dehydrogenase (short-subunit alcohol dehydrogenase family)